jgi:hypothetical protein
MMLDGTVSSDGMVGGGKVEEIEIDPYLREQGWSWALSRDLDENKRTPGVVQGSCDDDHRDNTEVNCNSSLYSSLSQSPRLHPHQLDMRYTKSFVVQST